MDVDGTFEIARLQEWIWVFVSGKRCSVSVLYPSQSCIIRKGTQLQENRLPDSGKHVYRCIYIMYNHAHIIIIYI